MWIIPKIITSVQISPGPQLIHYRYLYGPSNHMSFKTNLIFSPFRVTFQTRLSPLLKLMLSISINYPRQNSGIALLLHSFLINYRICQLHFLNIIQNCLLFCPNCFEISLISMQFPSSKVSQTPVPPSSNICPHCGQNYMSKSLHFTSPFKRPPPSIPQRPQG